MLIVCAALDKLSSCELSYAEHETLLWSNVATLKAACILPGYVMLFEGMPVILRVHNLSTDLGITNGSQGVVCKIFTAVCPAGFTYASCVLVEFPYSKVCLSDLPKGYYPILPSTWTFTTSIDCAEEKQENICVTRYQIPIQPAFAVMGHSAGGKTLPQVLINLHEGGFAAYVAASHAQTCKGLCITQPVTVDFLNKQIPSDLLVEVWCFEAIEHNTLVKCRLYQGPFVLVPDAEGEKTLTQALISVQFNTNIISSLTKKHCIVEVYSNDHDDEDSPAKMSVASKT
ncbi:hypothetical protein BDR07DRAFT_1278000 [Suillus spraguei]|nr:hypothetical protein BDR07DRAFT_1278000 [Suillus spraguei]